MAALGERAPAFSLPTGDGQVITNDALAGSPYVLYFYPKDDTPGCTTEACDFRDRHEAFAAKGVTVLGISRDTPEKHARFAAKHNLPFPLLSDTNGEACEAFGVWQEKKLYGKVSMGIVRTTFVVDAKGIIRAIYPKVKVAGHAEAVLAGL